MFNDMFNDYDIFNDYDMFRTYVKYISELIVLHSIDSINTIGVTDLEDFREFRMNNLITIKDAKLVDMYFNGKCGDFWLSAYDYPDENQEIYSNQRFIGEACDVGFLTFNIHNQS